MPEPRDAASLLQTLEGWVGAGALRPLDLALTRFIAEEGAESDPAVLLAAALTSERNSHGHVCLDLAGALRDPGALLSRLRDDAELSPQVRLEVAAFLRELTIESWVRRLAASQAIRGEDGAEPSRSLDADATPLVLAGTAEQPLLYLRRYWGYEQRIRTGIEARLAEPVSVDADALRHQLAALFDDEGARTDSPNWQRVACALAARSRFFIITGGPGTGKTTTVVRLLTMLQGLAAAAGEPALRIELAAPTGKAAARLNESIADQLHRFPSGAAAPMSDAPMPDAPTPDAPMPGAGARSDGRSSGLHDEMTGAAAIPLHVKTLHRLLGTIPESRRFRHHAANPLPADVVVVDEASMVDVELMSHLLDALRPEARLILLGDKDQLSSVEAGAVLGDLCERAAWAHYRPEIADWLRSASGDRLPPALIDPGGGALDQAIVMLRKSYRFSDDGGIGALAKTVNDSGKASVAGRLRQVKQLFERAQYPALGVIERRALAEPDDPLFAELIEDAYGGEGSYLRLIRDACPGADADRTAFDQWAQRILQAQKRFQLLTPLRQGAWGVDGLNQRVVALLQAQGLLPGEGVDAASPRQWFAGRPVLVTRNDYGLNLMNGDIGITLPVRFASAGPGTGPLAAPALSPGAGLGAPDSARPSAPGLAQGSASMLRVAFSTAEGGVRWVLPSRLQAVETVFAMTVHKSQGSEFQHTALILPDRPNPVLTQELLYTAITRARERFTLLDTDEAVLGAALAQRVQRASGLRTLGNAGAAGSTRVLAQESRCGR